MIKMDEEAVLCDMAETYHVLAPYELAPSLFAILAKGLPENARIKRKMAKTKGSVEEMLLANISDLLNLILWTKTKDGQKNRNRPKRITPLFLESVEEPKYGSFESAEEFEKARKEILEKIERRESWQPN